MTWAQILATIMIVPGILFALVVWVNGAVISFGAVEQPGESPQVLRFYTHKGYVLGKVIQYDKCFLAVPAVGETKKFPLCEEKAAQSYVIHSTCNSFKFSMLHLWAKKCKPL